MGYDLKTKISGNDKKGYSVYSYGLNLTGSVQYSKCGKIKKTPTGDYSFYPQWNWYAFGEETLHKISDFIKILHKRKGDK